MILTDSEIKDIAESTQSAEPGRDGYILPFTFARAIEAAVLEKLLKDVGEPYVWRAIGGSIWNHKTSEDDRALYTEEQVASAVAKARQEAPVQAQEPTLPEFFCGVDVDNNVISVSVLRRKPDAVAEVIHSEQIEIAALAAVEGKV